MYFRHSECARNVIETFRSILVATPFSCHWLEAHRTILRSTNGNAMASRLRPPQVDRRPSSARPYKRSCAAVTRGVISYFSPCTCHFYKVFILPLIKLFITEPLVPIFSLSLHHRVSANSTRQHLDVHRNIVAPDITNNHREQVDYSVS